MANPEHVAIVKQGSEATARWRRDHPDVRLDLSGADLREAHLRTADLRKACLAGTDLRAADLREADLSGADLTGADLFGADLSGADLTEADLWLVDFFLADLSESDLTRAFLVTAYLTAARLSEAKLSEASCGSTTLAQLDLSRVRDLETVHHAMPSSVGVDTLVRTLEGAGGQFSAAQRTFFTGAGVPETLLDYLPTLLESQPIQFFSCFISYGTPDEPFADRLYGDLKKKGLRCWKYDEDALVGRGVWANIDRAIAVHNKAIVICSRDSLQRPGVQREIERALQREDALKVRQAEAPGIEMDTDVLVPVRLDDYVLSDWQHPRRADVIAKHIGDFCGWDRGKAAYQRGLEQLLRALDPRSKLGLSTPTRITAKS